MRKFHSILENQRWRQWFGDLICRDFAKSKKPDKFLYRPTDRLDFGTFLDAKTEHIFDCRPSTKEGV